jgi:hypothetical protein
MNGEEVIDLEVSDGEVGLPSMPNCIRFIYNK